MNLKKLALCAIFVIAIASSASAVTFSWCALWGTCPPPAPPPFTPTYLAVTLNDQFGHVYPLNPWYFADVPTGAAVCAKLGCVQVTSRPCEFGGGGATCSAPELVLNWADGLTENAGLMASYWTRNPEDKFPNVALRLATDAMAADRAALKAKPLASTDAGTGSDRAFEALPPELQRWLAAAGAVIEADERSDNQKLIDLFPTVDWRFI